MHPRLTACLIEFGVFVVFCYDQVWSKCFKLCVLLLLLSSVQLWLLMTSIYIYIYIYALFKKLVLFAVKYLFFFFFLPITVFCGIKNKILVAALNKILILEHRW